MLKIASRSINLLSFVKYWRMVQNEKCFLTWRCQVTGAAMAAAQLSFLTASSNHPTFHVQRSNRDMGKARHFKNHVTPAVFSFVVTSTFV